MFDKILVPLDGSQLAECVLPHVVAIASAFEASVTLLRVLDSSYRGKQPVDPLESQLRKVEAEAYLDKVSARLEEANLFSEHVVEEGPAAQRINNAVRQRNIDLLILSSHGRSGLAEWNLSGVVEKIIQDLPASLLLVRAYREVPQEAALTPGYRRIMLPLDGSKRAECVLPAAEILARHWHAELLLTYIIQQTRLFRAAPLNAEDRDLLGRVVSRQREEADRYFRQMQERFPIQTDVHIAVEENIVAALEDVVRQNDVDLILFSAHGHGCSRFQRYGSLVSCCILYGSAPLLIFQDLPSNQVEPTAAKQALRAQEKVDVRRPSGTVHKIHRGRTVRTEVNGR